MWRTLLQLFPLRERWIEGDNYRMYYWLHPFHGGALSTPFRDRLALEWESDFTPVQLDFNVIAGKIGRSNLVVKDVGPFMSATEVAAPSLVQNYVNCEVTLDENIEGRFKHSTRKNLRKARDEYGLWVDVNPEGALENFYRLYLTSRRRLGVLPYPQRFFADLFRHLGGAVALFRCSGPSETLGYLVCYLHGSEMISGHLAYDFQQRYKRVSDLLFASAFDWGRQHGFTTYRFGADNRNQKTLLESKVKLGASPREQWDFHARSGRKREDNPDSLVRRILRGTPMPLYRHSGYLTGLYFG